MKFLGQDFQTLEHKQDRQTDRQTRPNALATALSMIWTGVCVDDDVLVCRWRIRSVDWRHSSMVSCLSSTRPPVSFLFMDRSTMNRLQSIICRWSQQTAEMAAVSRRPPVWRSASCLLWLYCTQIKIDTCSRQCSFEATEGQGRQTS